MGKLIMVRHGESEGNAIRRFTTSGEAKITDLGRRQALEAALRIKLKFQPTLVIASTFARARETGLIIAAELGIPIEYEAEFREQSLGDLAGQPYESIANDPTFDPKRSWVWRAPNGESHEDVLKRVAPVLDRVAAKISRRRDRDRQSRRRDASGVGARDRQMGKRSRAAELRHRRDRAS